MVERPIQLVDGVRAEGVAHLRPVERDAHRAGLCGAVVGDVGEVEALHHSPRGRVEGLAHSGSGGAFAWVLAHLSENRPTTGCPYGGLVCRSLARRPEGELMSLRWYSVVVDPGLVFVPAPENKVAVTASW